MTTELPRILICAYAFSPTLGSEFAQGWNYVRESVGRYRMTVLVGSSDGRMGDFAHLNHPSVAALGGDVELITIEPDWFCRLIKYLDTRWGLSWLFVFGLRRWHRLAFLRAQALHATKPFAAAHQLGPVGFRNPGILYRLGIPSYWGPIGGFQYINLKMAWRSDPKYGALCVIRNFSTWLAARSTHVRKAMQGFDRLSFATVTNRGNADRLLGCSGPVLSDQATEAACDKRPSAKSDGFQISAVWVGSIDGRKNISMLLDIAKAAQDMGAPVSFTVIGAGPLLAKARAQAAKLKLHNLNFTGRVDRSIVQKFLRMADALCFTSLSEANTSTLFEALEAGCIPFALALDGFVTNIPADVGFTFDITEGWDRVVVNYAAALDAIARDPAGRAEHVGAIWRRRHEYSWATLAGKHAAIVSNLIASKSSVALEESVG